MQALLADLIIDCFCLYLIAIKSMTNNYPITLSGGTCETIVKAIWLSICILIYFSKGISLIFFFIRFNAHCKLSLAQSWNYFLCFSPTHDVTCIVADNLSFSYIVFLFEFFFRKHENKTKKNIDVNKLLIIAFLKRNYFLYLLFIFFSSESESVRIEFFCDIDIVRPAIRNKNFRPQV